MLSSTRLAQLGGALLLAVVFLLPACSRMTVRTQVDPEANFSTYRTFAFAPQGSNQNRSTPNSRRLRAVNDPLFRAHVQEAITEDLRAKGLTLTRQRRSASLIIGYQTVIKDQADIMPPVYGVGWRGRTHVAKP